MYTPWGATESNDNIQRIDEGFLYVSTPSHGGYGLTLAFAKAHLSAAARKRGVNQGGYLWYEEDCLACIIDWELPQYWPIIYAHAPNTGRKDRLVRRISRWNPLYLIEIGVDPSPPEHAKYLARVEDMERRRAHDPDTITSAFGAWHALVPEGHTGVRTADGKFHLVEATSYKGGGGRLSACRVIKFDIERDSP